MRIGIKKTGLFKKIISSLNNIVNDVSFRFDEKGLTITEIDIGSNILVHIELKKSFFSEYQITDSQLFDINLHNFYKCLKTLGLKYEIYIHFFNDKVVIKGVNNQKSQSYTINKSTFNEHHFVYKESNDNFKISYNNVFNFKNTDKLSVFKDLDLDDISFKIKENRLLLASKNDDLEILNEFNDIDFIKRSPYNISSCYKLDNIIKIFSFLKIFEIGTISLNNNCPIKIEIRDQLNTIILVSSNIS